MQSQQLKSVVFELLSSSYTCEKTDDCVPRYKQEIYIPESLFPEIEQQVLISMTNTMKIPEDVNDDKRNLNR